MNYIKEKKIHGNSATEIEETKKEIINILRKNQLTIPACEFVLHDVLNYLEEKRSDFQILGSLLALNSDD